MPCSEEAEDGIISCFLQNPSVLLENALETIQPEYFYHHTKKLLYTTLQELYKAGAPIDLVTVSNYLIDKGLMDKMGGPSMLAELYSFVPTPAFYTHYRGILKDKHLLRQIINNATEQVTLAYEYQEDVPKLLDKVEQMTLGIRPKDHQKTAESVSDTMNDTFDWLEEKIKNPGILGTSTGFRWLDTHTGGFHPQIWYIGARPSCGKTSLELDFLCHQAFHLKIPCGFFSLEMGTRIVNLRILSKLSRVPLKKIMEGNLNRDEIRAISRARETIANGAKLLIDDRSGLTISQVRSKARRWVHDEGVKVIGLDYLQRMAGSGGKRDASRYDEHAENVRGLTDAQKELDITFVVLAQLNRKVEETKTKKPNMSHFEGCGTIEQDADVCLLLSRTEEDDRDGVRKVLFDLAKNRNGATLPRMHSFETEVASFKPEPIGF